MLIGASFSLQKVERVSSVSEATKLFQTLFTEKTGNVFGKPPYTKVGHGRRRTGRY